MNDYRIGGGSKMKQYLSNNAEALKRGVLELSKIGCEVSKIGGGMSSEMMLQQTPRPAKNPYYDIDTTSLQLDKVRLQLDGLNTCVVLHKKAIGDEWVMRPKSSVKAVHVVEGAGKSDTTKKELNQHYGSAKPRQISEMPPEVKMYVWDKVRSALKRNHNLKLALSHQKTGTDV
jgi:hypothetical protein